ncbi:MAG: hypothetical protein P4M12_10735 [Gammaproteobacteria bacterium]|nr:hypothetical protein [Gammaproteobacteria bacterium]
MIGTRSDIARLQSDFYRDCYHMVLKWLMVECIIILLLIVGIIYFVVTHPSPHYYATTSTGQIIPMIPMR